MYQESQLLVAYFFRHDKDERLRTADAILVDLLDQLLEQLPGVLDHFSAVLKKKYSERPSWNYSMLSQVFKRVITDANAGRVYLLIDALGIQPSSNTKMSVAHYPR